MLIALIVFARQKIEKLPHEMTGQLPEVLDSLRRRKRNLLACKAAAGNAFVVLAHPSGVTRGIDIERSG